VLLAKDLAAPREFYHDKLGLQIVREDENAIVFKCGGGTHLNVTKSTVGTADQQTQAAWQVRDIHAEVAELRAGKNPRTSRRKVSGGKPCPPPASRSIAPVSLRKTINHNSRGGSRA
jgi:catechol 2,3-dioxygenase-like lactoylglutathione lyase family enzyme